MPQRRNCPFYQIDLMCALALPHDPLRAESREIFLRRGYVLVFPDVMNDGNQFEDWYVHPDLVDMNFINSIKSNSSFEYTDIVKILTC